MDKDNKLKAPKAVRAFKIPNNIFRSCDSINDKSLSILISPEKKRSSPNLEFNFNISQIEPNYIEFEKDISNEFDELSVKSEIFSILREGSTCCDSPGIRNSNPTLKCKSNLLGEFFCKKFGEKSSPIRIYNPISKNFNLIEFSSEGNPIYNTCKKLN